MRSATIRWSQLPTYCENGPETGYEVTMLDSQKNAMYVVTLGLTKKRDLFLSFFFKFSPSLIVICAANRKMSALSI
jgi:hypothetical protein